MGEYKGFEEEKNIIITTLILKKIEELMSNISVSEKIKLNF